MTSFTVLITLIVLAFIRPAVAVIRFARLPAAARRHYPAALWGRIRWPWLARNCGLAYLDRYHRRIRPRMPLTTAVSVDPEQRLKLRYPVARFRADPYGLAVTVKTIPNVGWAEVEEAAPHLANAWRCHRVQIAQPRPGRLLIRGLRRDPLAEPLTMADAPGGVYGGKGSLPLLVRVYLGRDEWGADRFASLANITGAIVGGMPGRGKTTLANSLLCQLAPSQAVRLAIADGQGGADFQSWRQRAYAYVGDDRADAAGLLEDAHAEMRHRFATVVERTGHRNAWRVGPTLAFPLLLLIVDEAQSYLDESMVRGDRVAEGHVRTCRAMLGQLIRRGRSVMIFTLIMAHKPTTDSVPSFISANAGLRLAFGLETVDGAVSVLGETIRQHPTLSPVTLLGPESVGVMTARLTTSGSPYVRLRVPEIPEEAAGRYALPEVPPVNDRVPNASPV
jgi:S-DNA-T family DNA segregation ATPase FtsK/SpoIIIE